MKVKNSFFIQCQYQGEKLILVECIDKLNKVQKGISDDSNVAHKILLLRKTIELRALYSECHFTFYGGALEYC